MWSKRHFGNFEGHGFTVKVTDSLSGEGIPATGPALHKNNEASSKLTTANGGTFTSSSARLSSQSRYSMFDR